MKLIMAIVLAAFVAFPGLVRSAEKDNKEDREHLKQDILDHRAMAEAHLNAAKCLESGRSEKDCHAQLAKDCKGLGIGKYCGMKHKH